MNTAVRECARLLDKESPDWFWDAEPDALAEAMAGVSWKTPEYGAAWYYQIHTRRDVARRIKNLQDRGFELAECVGDVA